MLNALTIDIEDYFQVHAFSNVIKYEDWDNYESRVEKNVHKLLDLFDSIELNNSMNQTNPDNCNTTELRHCSMSDFDNSLCAMPYAVTLEVTPC
jgi:hypothetical protein